jgi:hypothetical protein
MCPLVSKSAPSSKHKKFSTMNTLPQNGSPSRAPPQKIAKMKTVFELFSATDLFFSIGKLRGGLTAPPFFHDNMLEVAGGAVRWASTNGLLILGGRMLGTFVTIRWFMKEVWQIFHVPPPPKKGE